MLVTTARFTTRNGPKYIAQLCKHFAHKIEATWSDNQGCAAFPTGLARMSADATGLDFRIEAADAKGLIQSRFAIDMHLVTFAHRENFMGLTWSIEGR